MTGIIPEDTHSVVILVLRIVLPLVLFWITFGPKLQFALGLGGRRHSREVLLEHRCRVKAGNHPVPRALETLTMAEIPEKEARRPREEDRQRSGGKEGGKEEAQRQRRRRQVAAQKEQEDEVAKLAAEKQMHLESLVNFVAFSKRDPERIYLLDEDSRPPPPPPSKKPPPQKKQLDRKVGAPSDSQGINTEVGVRANRAALVVLRGAAVVPSHGAVVAQGLLAHFADQKIDIAPATFDLLAEACIEAQHLEAATDLLMRMEATGLTPGNDLLDRVMELYVEHKRENEKETAEAESQPLEDEGPVPAESPTTEQAPSAAVIEPPAIDVVRTEIIEIVPTPQPVPLADTPPPVEKPTHNKVGKSIMPSIVAPPGAWTPAVAESVPIWTHRTPTVPDQSPPAWFQGQGGTNDDQSWAYTPGAHWNNGADVGSQAIDPSGLPLQPSLNSMHWGGTPDSVLVAPSASSLPAVSSVMLDTAMSLRHGFMDCGQQWGPQVGQAATVGNGVDISSLPAFCVPEEFAVKPPEAPPKDAGEEAEGAEVRSRRSSVRERKRIERLQASETASKEACEKTKQMSADAPVFVPGAVSGSTAAASGSAARLSDSSASANSKWQRFLSSNGLFERPDMEPSVHSQMQQLGVPGGYEVPRLPGHQVLMAGPAVDRAGAGLAWRDRRNKISKETHQTQDSEVVRMFKPGKVGMKANWQGDKIVTKIAPGGQADCNGVEVGMVIKKIAGADFSEEFLNELIAGEHSYTVTFKIKASLSPPPVMMGPPLAGGAIMAPPPPAAFRQVAANLLEPRRMEPPPAC